MDYPRDAPHTYFQVWLRTQEYITFRQAITSSSKAPMYPEVPIPALAHPYSLGPSTIN